MNRSFSARDRETRTWSEEERRIRLDALMLWWPYADGSLRTAVEELIEAAQQQIWDQEKEVQMLACAAATWPARVAVQQFADDHSDQLWGRLVARCLPTTQVLLKRLAEQEGTLSYRRLIASPQADLALHTAERLELELLLPQVYALLWTQQKGDMEEYLERAKERREELRVLFAASEEGAASSVFEHAMMYGEGA